MSEHLRVTTFIDMLMAPFTFIGLVWQYVFIGGTFLIIDFLGFGVMSEKENGTCVGTPMANLKWNVDSDIANRICCFNRKWAESRSYAFGSDITWEATLNNTQGDLTYYDSITGKALFRAPVGRTMAEFIEESKVHGWPSFRDEEVIWENVEEIWNGEIVSKDGTHLGHNLPDIKGNRHCINLVSIAGNQAQ